jgi:hypothetical protein
MKNINKIVYPEKNTLCQCRGFFCTTPNGADYTTCPFCEGTEYKYHNWENFIKYESDENNNIHHNFCDKCGVLYEAGCTHKVYGCTDDLYNAHVVRKWKDTLTGNIYIGMPQFENSEEWKSNVNNIEILEWVCVGAGHCPTEGRYSKVKYPQNYTQCSLT